MDPLCDYHKLSKVSAIQFLNKMSFLDKRWEPGSDPSKSPWFRVNVPNGYYVFYFCMANVVTISLNSFLNYKLYKRRDRLKQTFGGRLLLRLINTPLWVQVLFWSLITLFIDLQPYFKDVYILHKPSYIHWKLRIAIWKRSGRVAYALTPFIFLLSIKPSPLPKVLYLQLLPLHKWCSRLYVIFMSYHSITFMIKWLSNGEFWKKSLKFDMFVGVISFILWLIVLIIAIKPIRVRLYKTFYVLHMFATWTTVPLVYLHSRPDVNFFNILNMILMAYMIFTKLYFSFTNTELDYFNVESEDKSKLIVISIPRSYYKLDLKYPPGSHLRVHYRLLNPLAWLLPSHPYTITSVDTDDEVQLIVKETNFKIKPFTKYNFSIPYGSINPGVFDPEVIVHNMTIICGGSGIAFGLPLYRFFLQKTDAMVHLVWMVRNIHDLHIMVKFKLLKIDETGNYQLNEGYEHLDIYVTKDPNLIVEPANEEKVEFKRKLEKLKHIGYLLIKGPDDYIELNSFSADSASSEEQSFLEGQEENQIQNSIEPLPDFIHQSGRPDLSNIIEQDFQNDVLGLSNYLVSCGPTSMLNECKKLANQYNAEFIGESYSF